MSIMDENGVIVIVIGEAYKGGYKSITSRYELMLLDCGLEILGVCEWVKKILHQQFQITFSDQQMRKYLCVR